MKRLYIVRHAKAGDHAASQDFDRQLTTKGQQEASQTGKMLADKRISVDLLLTSPAARTLETATAIAHELNFPVSKMESNNLIYNAEDTTLLNIIEEVDDKVETVLLVGHNPGITEFANSIFRIMITSMATAGVISGTLPIDSWRDIKWGVGLMEFYLTPEVS